MGADKSAKIVMTSRPRSSPPVLSLRSANGVGLVITQDVTYFNFDVDYYFQPIAKV